MTTLPSIGLDFITRAEREVRWNNQSRSTKKPQERELLEAESKGDPLVMEVPLPFYVSTEVRLSTYK
jgi:hypothetical protein